LGLSNRRPVLSCEISTLRQESKSRVSDRLVVNWGLDALAVYETAAAYRGSAAAFCWPSDIVSLSAGSLLM